MSVFYSSEEKITKFSNNIESNFHMTDTIGSNNYINSLNIINYKKECGSAGINPHVNVPESHKRAADSYVLVRQIFGTPVIHTRLSQEDKQMLLRFDFYPIEFTTSKQMEQEVEFLKKWSNEGMKDLKESADKIIMIRAKELKHIIATNYITVKRELYDGYKTLDRYFQEISKYNRTN